MSDPLRSRTSGFYPARRYCGYSEDRHVCLAGANEFANPIRIDIPRPAAPVADYKRQSVLDDAASYSRAATAERLGNIGIIVAAGMNDQRAVFNVFQLETRRQYGIR